jgi:hypothetical protein
VQLVAAIIGILIYYAYMAAVGKWCRNNNVSRPLAFRVGAAACLLLALVTIVAVSLYFGRIMLINEDPLITAGCVIALTLLGGLRCRDHVSKQRPPQA